MFSGNTRWISSLTDAYSTPNLRIGIKMNRKHLTTCRATYAPRWRNIFMQIWLRMQNTGLSASWKKYSRSFIFMGWQRMKYFTPLTHTIQHTPAATAKYSSAHIVELVLYWYWYLIKIWPYWIDYLFFFKAKYIIYIKLKILNIKYYIILYYSYFKTNKPWILNTTHSQIHLQVIVQYFTHQPIKRIHILPW